MTTEEYFDVDPDELHKGGFDVVAPGFYVAQVTSVTDGEQDNYVFDFLVVSAAKGREAEVGKTHREWVAKNNKTGNQRKRQALILALGLSTADELKRLHEQGKGIPVDWYGAPLGRCLCLEISAEEGDDGKIRHKVPYWNYYHIDSKEGRKFPVDHKAIAAAVDAFQQRTSDPWDKPQTPATGGQANAAADDFDPFA